jgi:hypothetical protein
MTVIGLTAGLRGDAEEQCGEGFSAWIAEAGNGTWGSWEELVKHFPKVIRTDEDEVHFPLTTDGTGVRASVFFKLQLLMLRCIRPAPLTARPLDHHRISNTPVQRNTPANANPTL